VTRRNSYELPTTGYYCICSCKRGRIIHEAGEAEVSGPGPQQGPGPPGTTKIYKV